MHVFILQKYHGGEKIFYIILYYRAQRQSYMKDCHNQIFVL